MKKLITGCKRSNLISRCTERS